MNIFFTSKLQKCIKSNRIYQKVYMYQLALTKCPFYISTSIQTLTRTAVSTLLRSLLVYCTWSNTCSVCRILSTSSRNVSLLHFTRWWHLHVHVYMCYTSFIYILDVTIEWHGLQELKNFEQEKKKRIH